MKNKTILIIGGTGALGKTLIKRYYDENKIIVFSRDEHKHVDLMKEYNNIESHLGDIRDKDSIINCLSKFKPNVVIGTGGFASGPTLLIANLFRIPIFIQEQNSYPGITNKILSKYADKIFVSYDKMKKLFLK